MKPLSDPFELARRFVEGTLSPVQFRDAVLSGPEHLFADHEISSRDDSQGFELCIEDLRDLDYGDPVCVLDAQDILCEYLDRNAVPYTRSRKHSDFLKLVVAAAPNWVNPNHKFVAEFIMRDAGDRTGDELRIWLSAKIGEYYRCACNPPKWNKSPAWPVSENGPLVFLGQMDILGYFQSKGTAYLFFDSVNRQCKTILQFV